MTLHLWTEQDLEAHLDNEGVLFRSSYFGDLVLTPKNLKEQHELADSAGQKALVEAGSSAV